MIYVLARNLAQYRDFEKKHKHSPLRREASVYLSGLEMLTGLRLEAWDDVQYLTGWKSNSAYSSEFQHRLQQIIAIPSSTYERTYERVEPPTGVAEGMANAMNFQLARQILSQPEVIEGDHARARAYMAQYPAPRPQVFECTKHYKEFTLVTQYLSEVPDLIQKIVAAGGHYCGMVLVPLYNSSAMRSSSHGHCIVYQAVAEIRLES